MSDTSSFTMTAVRSKPVFGVDLVSNSDKMLRAHRRNQHQSTALHQRLDTMDRKCRRAVDRIRDNIRDIYVTEQLPLELEVAELEARRRREQRLQARQQRDLVRGIDEVVSFEGRLPYNKEPVLPDVTGETGTVGMTSTVTVPMIEIQCASAPGSPSALQSNARMSQNHLSERRDSHLELPSSGTSQLNDGGSFRQVNSAAGRTPMTPYLPEYLYGHIRRPSTMTRSWRRPSILQVVERVSSFQPSDIAVCKDTHPPSRQEQDRSPRSKQKSTEEVMNAVRAVYEKSLVQRGLTKSPQQTSTWKNVAPLLHTDRLSFRSGEARRPPQPAPAQTRSQVKERFEVLLARLQKKYRPGGREDGDNKNGEADIAETVIDFNEEKWKPYKILLESHRERLGFSPEWLLSRRRSCYTRATKLSSASAAFSPTGSMSCDRFYRNRKLSDGGFSEDGESMMSFVLHSRSTSRNVIS